MILATISAREASHGCQVPEDEGRHTVAFDDSFTIVPDHFGVGPEAYAKRHGGRVCPDGFCYTSDRNPEWLSVDQLRAMIAAGET